MITTPTLVTRMNQDAPLEGSGTELHRTKNLMKCVYDFAVLGGAVGTTQLLDDLGNLAKLPAGAIVTRVLVDSVTSPTSGGAATIAFRSKTAGDLLGATAFGSLTAGLYDGVPVNTAATAVKMTAETAISITIATAALTGGKINVYVEYNAS